MATKRDVAAVGKRLPIIWVHITKAGGTTMCQLAHMMHERVVRPADPNYVIGAASTSSSSAPQSHTHRSMRPILAARYAQLTSQRMAILTHRWSGRLSPPISARSNSCMEQVRNAASARGKNCAVHYTMLTRGFPRTSQCFAILLH